MIRRREIAALGVSTRIASLAVLCAVAVGEARADQFDLVCKGTYETANMVDVASGLVTPDKAIQRSERQYQVSMDTDARLVRARLDNTAWFPVVKLRETPNRYEFEDHHGLWVFDRETGRGGFAINNRAVATVFAASCERSEYTLIPELKF